MDFRGRRGSVDEPHFPRGECEVARLPGGPAGCAAVALLYRGARGLPQHRSPVRRARADAPCRPVGRGGGVPARTLPQGLRSRPASARLPRGLRRRADRPVLRDHQGGGDGAPRLRRPRGGARHPRDRSDRPPPQRPVAGRRRRSQRQPQQPHHRLPADRRSRAGMDEAQGPARGAGRREDFSAGHHGAVGRLRRCRSKDHGAARGRPLCRERLENVHHLGHARRLLHRGRPHRRTGRGWCLVAADRARPRGLCPHEAQEDGLVGVGHRPALFRQC